jgi:hypothetical protein
MSEMSAHVNESFNYNIYYVDRGDSNYLCTVSDYDKALGLVEYYHKMFNHDKFKLEAARCFIVNYGD